MKSVLARIVNERSLWAIRSAKYPTLQSHSAQLRQFTGGITANNENIKTLTLNISKEEYELFDYLKRVKKYYNLRVDLRVAGGWVRDKLMGLPCDDIDITLNNMMGTKFAKFIVMYQDEVFDQPIRFHTVKINPEQSKHLETAKIRLFGKEVDFSNARTEIYDADSRIPKIEFGSIKQDAERRDFTINSLYLNIDNFETEDYTGKGIQDLYDKVIRTPLEPKQTLLDDPLRCLRGIRFASRFNFKLDEKLVETMKDPLIVQCLLEKVSRERIGGEIKKSLSHRNSVIAAKMILDTELHSKIFPSSLWTDLRKNLVYAACDHINSHLLQAEFVHSEQYRMLMTILSFLCPIHDISEKWKDFTDLLEVYVKDGLRFSNFETQSIRAIFARSHHLIKVLIEQYNIDFKSMGVEMLRMDKRGLVMHAQFLQLLCDKIHSNPVPIGQWAFNCRELHYEPALILTSCILRNLVFEELVNKKQIDMQSLQSNGTSFAICVNEALRKTDIKRCLTMPMVVAGYKIGKLLGIGPSAVIGTIKDKVVEWQILEPNITEEEASQRIMDCEEAKIAKALEENIIRV